MTDIAGVTHHLVLNGQGYMLHQSTAGLAYQRREAPYLVPRRADAVGRAALTRPGEDNGGLGQGVQVAFGQGGYGRAQGCDGRAGDGLRIAGKLDGVTGLARQVNTWAEFNGTVYAGTETGASLCVFKYNAAGNSFSENAAPGAAEARLVAFANYLWLAVKAGGAGTLDLADTAAGASGANSAGIVDLARSGTKLVGVTAAGATRAVRWASLGADAAPTLGFTTANEDGDPREPLAGIVALGETFYLAKLDGLYRLTLNSTTPSASLSLVADHRRRRDAGNFRALVAFGDRLYYNVRDRLYSFDGATERDVSPPASVVGPTGEAVTRYSVKALAAGSGWLWALTESDETPRAVHLWGYTPGGGTGNGQRWEQVLMVVTASDAAAGSLHYSPSTSRLFLNTYSSGGWATTKVDLRATSDLPGPSYEPSGNVCYLPPIDGGLPEVVKRWHAVVLRGGGFSAATPVVVTYWTGATWALVGSLSSGLGGELPFPASVTLKHLLLRLDLRSNGTATPIVREVGVTYDVLPGPARVVEFEAVLAPNLRLLDGTVEADTPTALLANLDQCRAAGAVVSLADPVTSATGAAPLTVRVVDVALKTLLAIPTAGGQYGWLVAVRCEVV